MRSGSDEWEVRHDPPGGRRDIGVMRKAAIPLIFWYHTARKFMMSMTQYNAKIKSISVKWSEI